MQTPALLAPGGDFLSAKAAILAGADEVYVGLGRFNARRRATNLEINDIRRLCALARQHGASIYITTNVLITDDEIEEMIGLIGECNAVGAAGVIVQDPGLLNLLHSRLPELELHASTQMTVHNRAQIDWLARFGVRRINLARELTLDEIRLLSAHAAEGGIETEVFVHGAYCVSYSGQCYMSSFMGGLSGNRGVCFQPCRRFYTAGDAGERRLALSLKDNNALAHVHELAAAGVGALKIEGRMKGPWYVDTLVRAYRRALDGGENIETGGHRSVAGVFNRGFSAGYLEDAVGPEMFVEHPFDASLVPAGVVTGYRADERRLTVAAGEADRTPAAGDSGVIYTEENRFIALIEVEEPLSAGELRIAIREALKGRIEPGMRLFLQPDLEQQGSYLRKLENEAGEGIPVAVEVEARPDEPLHSRWRALYSDEDVALCDVASDAAVEAARSRALDADVIETQFAKLGGTPFELDAVSLYSDEPVFLPLGELNAMRRRATELLVRRNGIEPHDFTAAGRAAPPPAVPGEASPRLLAAADTGDLEELNRAAALTGRPDDVLLCVDPLLDGLFDRRGLPAAGGYIFPAVIPDDQFDAAAEFLERLVREQPRAAVITANSGIAAYAGKAGLDWIAGSDLHTVNSWGGASFLGNGARAAVVSRELSGGQIFKLLEKSAPGRLYIPVFGPLLLMTTRQCLYGRSFGCPKETSDSKCRDSCARSGRITDEQGNHFLIEKRPGRWTELYNEALLAVPEAVPRFGGKAAGWYLDLRIDRRAGSRWSPGSLLALFAALDEDAIRGDEVRAELKELLGAERPITWGNYKRGLQ